MLSFLKTGSRVLCGAVAVCGSTLLAPGTFAASHSDAPLIKLDPQANITDVYTFVGTKYNNANTKVLNVIVAVHPFCEPGDGVIYDKFSDDARYSIHIANPNTGAELRRYDFRFSDPSAGLKNQNTILSYGLGTAVGPIDHISAATRNYTQTYDVFKTPTNGSTTQIGNTLLTPPPNVGKRTTPAYNDADGFAVSGASTVAGLDTLTKEAVHELSSGEVVFAGSREDGFYADAPGIFDLLDSRIIDNNNQLFGDIGPFKTLGQDGNGSDGFKGFNVLVFAIQIPLSDLPSLTYTPVFSGALGLDASATQGVGVFASVSRPRVTLRSESGAPNVSGPWVQVNRMGNPLFNEVLVALKDKDKYNRTKPENDIANGFDKYALNPEIAFLINYVLFGDTSGQAPLATTGRADLKAVYIPDVLRVSTKTDPVHVAGTAGFSRLSFIGGDTVSEPSTGAVRSAGWPNGRRLGDDVADIALTAVASGPTYNIPSPANTYKPGDILVVGDNVDHNDMAYNQVFPYAATPHSGAKNKKDSF